VWTASENLQVNAVSLLNDGNAKLRSPKMMNQNQKIRAAAILLFLFSLAIWLPAIHIPFWGDDYHFLIQANTASLEEQSIWAPFWPEKKYKSWRPLSQDSYWRVVVSALKADPRAAHVANFVLLVCAALGVGLLGFIIADSLGWPNSKASGLLAALLYSTLALHFLPVYWVSAANSSLLVLFTTLYFSAFLVAQRREGFVRFMLWVAALVAILLALLSKESAALSPILLLCLSLFVWPHSRPDKEAFLVWILSCLMVIFWLIARSEFVSDPGPEYELTLGFNNARNVASLLAWFINVPREALRMVVNGELVLGFIWAASVALPFVFGMALMYQPVSRALRPGMVFALVSFVIVAYAPYFLLNWNSYAYYAAVAVILPAIIFAQGLVRSPIAIYAVVLVGISSLLSVHVNRYLDHPGLIGRAFWAEESLSKMAAEKIEAPLFIVVADEQRFYAVGTAGIAWRLNLKQQDINLVNACPKAALLNKQCFEMKKNGEFVRLEE